MSQHTLKPEDENKIISASNGPLISALERLDIKSTWLPTNHPILNFGQIDKEHMPGGKKALKDQELAEYLSVAGPLHCGDGWSYLSRSLNALFIGDSHTAWHLAYYAELRAAQSILSAHGIGAFNYWNCIINSKGIIEVLSQDNKIKHTHTMVWLMLRFLSERKDSLIRDVMKISNHPIIEIINYALPGISGDINIYNWIEKLIFDLKISADDKQFRNQCSYYPHHITKLNLDQKEYIETVKLIWNSLEPSFDRSTFDFFDASILKEIVIEESRKNLALNPNNITDEQLKERLRVIHQRITNNAPELESIITLEFLVDFETEFKLLSYAQDQNMPPKHPLTIISRATLLLRIATGVSRNLLASANKHNDINDWLNQLAINQGLISNLDQAPEDRTDFHADGIHAARELEDQFNNGNTTLYALLGAIPAIRPDQFTQLERVVQWGFR